MDRTHQVVEAGKRCHQRDSMPEACRVLDESVALVDGEQEVTPLPEHPMELGQCPVQLPSRQVDGGGEGQYAAKG